MSVDSDRFIYSVHYNPQNILMSSVGESYF